jgi:cullin-4
MIESTLALKRFADGAIAALFATDGDVTMELDGPEDVFDSGRQRSRLTGDERTRQMELEEAIRTGFKIGMGSRQNAPAEWIGMCLVAV